MRAIGPTHNPAFEGSGTARVHAVAGVQILAPFSLQQGQSFAASNACFDSKYTLFVARRTAQTRSSASRNPLSAETAQALKFPGKFPFTCRASASSGWCENTSHATLLLRQLPSPRQG